MNCPLALRPTRDAPPCPALSHPLLRKSFNGSALISPPRYLNVPLHLSISLPLYLYLSTSLPLYLFTSLPLYLHLSTSLPPIPPRPPWPSRKSVSTSRLSPLHLLSTSSPLRPGTILITSLPPSYVLRPASYVRQNNHCSPVRSVFGGARLQLPTSNSPPTSNSTLYSIHSPLYTLSSLLSALRSPLSAPVSPLPDPRASLHFTSLHFTSPRPSDPPRRASSPSPSPSPPLSSPLLPLSSPSPPLLLPSPPAALSRPPRAARHPTLPDSDINIDINHPYLQPKPSFLPSSQRPAHCALRLRLRLLSEFARSLGSLFDSSKLVRNLGCK
ncbi:hypothetical protein C8R47DRAFT_1286569 [Mycena vitilis]|nr:hypothetical protein C8R47DRAFT_1286569 [Mycena vitilis]